MSASIFRSHNDAEVLWEPAKDADTDSRLGRYIQWLLANQALEFRGYSELWHWSTQDLRGLWGSIWQYFDIIADGDPTQVLVDEVMPGAQWFPDVTLNYAENLLRGHEEQIVVTALSQTRGGHHSYARRAP